MSLKKRKTVTGQKEGRVRPRPINEDGGNLTHYVTSYNYYIIET